jgi:hypothetical protein
MHICDRIITVKGRMSLVGSAGDVESKSKAAIASFARCVREQDVLASGILSSLAREIASSRLPTPLFPPVYYVPAAFFGFIRRSGHAV